MQNTISCPHCGKVLKARIFEVFGRSIPMGYETCCCEGAEEERARIIEEQAREAIRNNEADRIRRYEKAGIKPRFLGADAECGQYVNEVLDGGGLYFHGPVGTGKTYLACSIAKRLCDSLVNVRLTKTLGVLSDLKATFGSSGATEDDVFNSLAKCQVLIIDDLGKEAPSEWVLSVLFRVIDDRSESLKPIIVTSNYCKSDLAERLAGGGAEDTAVAIVSRLEEMCRTVELGGDDRRIRV